MSSQDLPTCHAVPDGDSLKESESDSEDDDLDYAACDSDDEYIDNHGDSTIHPVLMNDIQLMKENCCNGTISYRSLNELCEMDLEISFPTALLEKIVAEAWGLSFGEPIVIRLSVDQHYYLDTNAVKRIEVSQKRHSNKPSVLMQLKMIVEEFCRKQFCELTNESVKTAIEESLDDCGIDVQHLKMVKLLDFGFKWEDIVHAYRLSDGNNDNAIYFLQQMDGAFCIDNLAQNIVPPLQKAKEIPTLKKGFLIQLYLYIEQRLLTLNSFCPICDNAHSLAVGVMLKPVICSNPLCIFSYETLGVTTDLAHNIVTNPEVVNLLILLTKAGAKSERRDVIFYPYPTVAHPSKVNEMAMHRDTRDFKLLNVVLGKIPDVQEMLMNDQAEFMKMLSEKHELCYPLLRWIISSNRSHIVKLPKEMQLDFMGTQHQFLMRSSPPLKEREFRIHREKYGSVFAFHGSPIENWHSIVRNGLIVASGTELMIHGAVYGRGIYLSPLLETSIAYLKNLDTPLDLLPGKSVSTSNYIKGRPEFLKCITLCEVIDCPTLKKCNGNIWICDDSDYVCTRFFFVYDEYNRSERASCHTNTTTPAIHEQVKQAIAANMVNE